MSGNDARISLNRGYNLIRGECSSCPLRRDYDARYYCILGLVDGCTKCRFDYVPEDARTFYNEGGFWIEVYNDLARDVLIDQQIRAPR